MLTVILPASHIKHFYEGVSDPYSQTEPDHTVFEHLDCAPWGTVGYSSEGWFEMGIPSEKELEASLGAGDCVGASVDGGLAMMSTGAGDVDYNCEGSDSGSTTPSSDTCPATPSDTMEIQTSIMDTKISTDDLDVKPWSLLSEPSLWSFNEISPGATTADIPAAGHPSTTSASKWPPAELPSFLIDCPAFWDRDCAHPEDVYLAACDDGVHLFVPMIGAFGRLDREGERRFFPLAEKSKVEVMCAIKEGDENEELEGRKDDGVNVAVNVDVEDVANEKN